MTDPAVTYEAQDRIGVLTLRRPDNRNAMTPELLAAFAEATRRAGQDRSTRCVILTGTGSCFSAGADLKKGLQQGDHAAPHERSFAMYTSFLSLLDLEVPVVGALGGHAVGGGFGLALLCDLRVASETAKLGANFARIGLHSGLGISYLLPRLIGVPRANELLLTGKLIRGREAADWGLVNAAVPTEEVWGRALSLAEEVAGAAPYAVRTMKASMRRFLEWDIRGAAWHEAFAQAASLETKDAAEGMSALLEKRAPAFEGR